MDVALAQLTIHDTPLHQFTDEEMPEVIDALKIMRIGKFSGATRGFIFATSAGVQVGIEIDACLLDPIMIAKPKASRLSGKGPDGRIGA